MRGSAKALSGLRTFAIVGAFAAAVAPPALGQGYGPYEYECTGTDTFGPHDEAHESPLFEACEQLQGTEAAETAAEPPTAARVATAGIGALRSQSNAVATTISGRIRDLARGVAGGLGPAASSRARYLGMSAGSPGARWGAWGDASGSFLENTTSAGYDGSSVVALAGIDYLADKKWILGFSAGYTHADLGLKSIPASRVSDGAVFGPYLAYIIGRHASIDGQFNYAHLSNEVASGFPFLSGRFDSNRLTGAANLNLYADKGPIKLTGFAGYAYSWEGSDKSVFSKIPPFSDNIRYGVLKLGGEAGYQISPKFEAYVPLTFQYETTTPHDGTSRTALVVGAGLRYQWSDRIKGGLLAKTTEVKSHTQDVFVGANLRIAF